MIHMHVLRSRGIGNISPKPHDDWTAFRYTFGKWEFRVSLRDTIAYHSLPGHGCEDGDYPRVPYAVLIVGMVSDPKTELPTKSYCPSK